MRAALPGGAARAPCIQAITLASQAASGHSKPATPYTASSDLALPVRRMPTRINTALPRSPATSNAAPPPFSARRQGYPRNPALLRGLNPAHTATIPGQCGLPCMLPSLHSPARACRFSGPDLLLRMLSLPSQGQRPCSRLYMPCPYSYSCPCPSSSPCPGHLIIALMACIGTICPPVPHQLWRFFWLIVPLSVRQNAILAGISGKNCAHKQHYIRK